MTSPFGLFIRSNGRAEHDVQEETADGSIIDRWIGLLQLRGRRTT